MVSEIIHNWFEIKNFNRTFSANVHRSSSVKSLSLFRLSMISLKFFNSNIEVEVNNHTWLPFGTIELQVTGSKAAKFFVSNRLYFVFCSTVHRLLASPTWCGGRNLSERSNSFCNSSLFSPPKRDVHSHLSSPTL